MTVAETLRAELDRLARVQGFDAIGIAPPEGHATTAERLAQFVGAGHHGTMDWMKTTLVRRSSPKALWPDVRSIAMLAINYGPETDPLAALERKGDGTISVYARNRDYHGIIKGRLKTIAGGLLARARRLGEDGEVKVFVDTAPVMEKPLAERAGLGWQGKHTNLVSREFGSWLFLGSIFTNLELPVDISETDHCGSCRACLDICPTGAFPAPYQLDARRCISYLTIEHDGPIPEEFRKPMGNRIFGCDDCLAVCPWNKFASRTSEAKLAAPEDHRDHTLAHFLALNNAAFRQRFSGSPVKRIGIKRFLRNCLIAAGNSGRPELLQPITDLAGDEDETVAETARWALAQLKDIS